MYAKGKELKERFIQEAQKSDAEGRKYLIAAVKLPTGAIEIITNTENIQSKIDYYISAYDENFKLKTNAEVEIVGFMLI